jgi:SAM-dependent methyltransferase
MKRIPKALDRVYRRVADELGLLLGQRDELTPPYWMFSDPDRLDGSHNVREFVSIGESTVSWLISEGLAPSHRVLEIGCGIGRMALPLTRRLTNGGSYDGIDITLDKIHYCKKTIGRRYTNFRFHQADVYNKYYNPCGKLQASEYRFPFDDKTFDFVFLISVFTHMLPTDMEHYLSEIARVLVRGAKCISSFWLTDVKLGSPYYDYSEVCEIYSKEEPEHGVFYIEEFVRSLYRRYGLTVGRLVHGSWITREDSDPNHQQDIIIAVRQG